MYRIECKLGYVITDDAGNITEDHCGRHYTRVADPSWCIVGFTRRHHSRHMITLAEAANGADFGQGWVHDVDHGTRRMWGMPAYRRAVKVTRISAAKGADL